MTATVVRYRVKPGRGEENAELVRAVYAELAALAPDGFRYATFVMEDGVSFVHVAFTESDAPAPLPQLEAFGRFRAGLAERCAEPPQSAALPTQIGAYGL
jgi:hypothetical protein